MRVVLDSGVIVSAAILPGSVPRRAIDKAMACAVVLLSGATNAEVSEVARRPKFDRYAPLEVRLELLDLIIDQAETVVVTSSLVDCRDPKDNKYLELAVDGSANFIVTGDRDLLSLNPFRGIRIITPVEFLQLTTVP